MDAERKEIIVRENERWRRGRLLPEHYCDFLLNLYQGERAGERPGRRVLGVSSEAIRDSGLRGWMAFMAVTAIISCFVFYFTSFRLPMQIALTSIFVLAAFIAGALFREKIATLSYACFGAGCIALFAAGFVILNQRGWLDSNVTMGFVAFCSLVWIAVGLSARMHVFHFCGWAGLLLIYAHVLKSGAAQLNWLTVEMSFMPLSVLFLWIGWLLAARYREASPVFFLLGGLLWFSAEPFMLYARIGGEHWISIVFLVKMVSAGAILFAFRKTWTEWVGG